MLGRRGPAQAAFTNPELRELGELADADVIVDPAELELDAASAAWLESDDADRTARATSRSCASTPRATPHGQAAARSSCASCARRSRSSATDASRAIGSCATSCSPTSTGTCAPVTPTTEETIDCGLVFRSVGYRGVAHRRASRSTSARGTIPNDGGRVLRRRTARRCPATTRAGWIKRGPSGVIGTNKKDAHGDGRRAPRGPRGRPAPAAASTPRPSSTRCWTSAARRVVDYAGWEAHRRSTSAPPASRTAARA